MRSSEFSTVSLWFFLILANLHNAAAPGPPVRGPVAHPPFQIEQPPEVVRPGSGGDPNNRLTGVSDGGQPQPFLPGVNLELDNYSFRSILLKYATVIETVSLRIQSQKSLGINVNPATITLAKNDAEEGCSVYSFYQSNCRVNRAAMGIGYLLGSVDTAKETSLFASCACYSNTYWVPDLYDNAVWGCAQVRANNTGFTPYLAPSTASATGFCRFNNPRSASYEDALQALTATSTPTATAEPGSSAQTTSATPTSTPVSSGASAVTISGVGDTKLTIWAKASLLVLVLVLV